MINILITMFRLWSVPFPNCCIIGGLVLVINSIMMILSTLVNMWLYFCRSLIPMKLLSNHPALPTRTFLIPQRQVEKSTQHPNPLNAITVGILSIRESIWKNIFRNIQVMIASASLFLCAFHRIIWPPVILSGIDAHKKWLHYTRFCPRVIGNKNLF